MQQIGLHVFVVVCAVIAAGFALELAVHAFVFVEDGHGDGAAVKIVVLLERDGINGVVINHAEFATEIYGPGCVRRVGYAIDLGERGALAEEIKIVFAVG